MKKIYFILFTVAMLFSYQADSQCNGFAFGQAACSGGCTGKATAVGFGGTAPYTYLWSNGASGSAATALCVATYTVIISDGAGCAVSKTAGVTVQAPPSITVASGDATCSTCADGSASVTPAGAGIFTYTWAPNTSTNDTAFSLTPGTYTVCVTNFVTSCDSCTTVTVGFTTGIKNPSAVADNIKIYPNPVKDVVNIEFNASISGSVKLSVVNILGEEVYSEKIETKNQEIRKLQMNEVSPGVYFINVKYKDFTTRQKIIKE